MFDFFIKVMSVVKNYIGIFVVGFLFEKIEEFVCIDEVEDCENGRYILVEKLIKIFFLILSFMIKFLLV